MTHTTISRLLPAALAAGISCAAVSAHAATFKVYPAPVNIIFISGEIEQGDFAKFEAAAKTLTGQGRVAFDSKGGNVLAGLQIAETIRDRGFTTWVGDNKLCASICGIMWLAGTQRYAVTTSHIGFHAAADDKGAESGAGSAVIGAFLSHIGLSYKAILYTMTAPPSGIDWFNATKANDLGILVTTVPAPTPASTTAAPTQPPAPVVAKTTPPVAYPAPNTPEWTELNTRLNASEAFLRQKAGAEAVVATVAWIKSAAAKDPSVWQTLYAQPDPYGWAYAQMVEAQKVSSRMTTPPVAKPMPPVSAQEYERALKSH